MKNPNSKSQQGAVLAFSLVMLLLLTLAGTRMIQQNKQQLEMANNARLLTQEFSNAEGLLEEAKNMINSHMAHDNWADSTSSLGINYFDFVGRTDPTPNLKQLINDPSHQCTPISTGTSPNEIYKQNILLAGTDLFQTNAELKKIVNVNGVNMPRVVILSVSCKLDDAAAAILNTDSFQSCSSYENGTVKCHPKSGDSNCTGVEIDAVNILKFNQPKEICYQDYDPLSNRPACDNDVTCTVPRSKCPQEIYTIQVVSKNENGTIRILKSDYQVGCRSDA